MSGEPDLSGLDPLVAEMAAVTLGIPAIRALEAAGVPLRTVGEMFVNGDLAVAQVELARGGSRFGFGGPDRRLVIAARVHGEVRDLVALASADESQWALRLGAADFLGEEWIDRAAIGACRELRLLRTPMDWLRAGGPGCAGGVCVLDWTPAALAALRGLGPKVTLVCDPGVGPKLRAMLEHGGLPLVAEARGERRAA